MAQIMSFLPMLLIFGAMFFFMSRSQKKQQEARKQLLNSMSKGAQVITIGGLHGTVDSVNDATDTVDLDCEGVILTFDRQAIRTILPAQTGVGPVEDNNTPIEDATI
jgi:preprotein translocase subunit YajC